MALTTRGIWFSKDYIVFEMKPLRKANIFDVFKHLSKAYLRMQPDCGRVTAEEIATALKEEGFELPETIQWSTNEKV